MINGPLQRLSRLSRAKIFCPTAQVMDGWQAFAEGFATPPAARGSVPSSVQPMRDIGAWMKVNGEAIYGTSASPCEKLAWGRCTQKKLADGTTRLYLHVFDWPRDGKLIVPPLNGKPLKASLLRDGKALEFSPANGGVIIAGLAEAPDKIASVVVVVVADLEAK